MRVFLCLMAVLCLTVGVTEAQRIGGWVYGCTQSYGIVLAYGNGLVGISTNEDGSWSWRLPGESRIVKVGVAGCDVYPKWYEVDLNGDYDLLNLDFRPRVSRGRVKATQPQQSDDLINTFLHSDDQPR